MALGGIICYLPKQVLKADEFIYIFIHSIKNVYVFPETILQVQTLISFVCCVIVYFTMVNLNSLSPSVLLL